MLKTQSKAIWHITKRCLAFIGWYIVFMSAAFYCWMGARFYSEWRVEQHSTAFNQRLAEQLQTKDTVFIKDIYDKPFDRLCIHEQYSDVNKSLRQCRLKRMNQYIVTPPYIVNYSATEGQSGLIFIKDQEIELIEPMPRLSNFKLFDSYNYESARLEYRKQTQSGTLEK